jgi:hypothetical protein
LKLKVATIHEIKSELQHRTAEEARALCLRLAKFKKENKELLTYLLFESHDEQQYVNSVREDTTHLFQEITNLNLYYAKKSIRKILRLVNKHIRYSGIPTTELDLRIHFCEQVNGMAIEIDKSPVLRNLYDQQLKKINQVLAKLDEDLQFDYQAAIQGLHR